MDGGGADDAVAAGEQAGLEVLINSRSITTTMKAVGSLEIATRYSPECAHIISEMGAVARLYLVLQSCNRSKPHLMLAKQTLQTLFNFTAHGAEFRAKVSQLPIAADVLAEFAQTMRDTDEECVLQAVKLLRWISADPQTSADISGAFSVNGQPTAVERLGMTLKCLERKGKPAGAQPSIKAVKGPSLHEQCVKEIRMLLKKDLGVLPPQ